jgi:putative transposase
MHALMRRQGWVIGRDQTGRIMRNLGLRGVRRSKRVFTTRTDPAAARPADLVQRQFTAAAPRQLWVADIERHEALSNRVEVGDLHRRAVAAVWQ